MSGFTPGPWVAIRTGDTATTNPEDAWFVTGPERRLQDRSWGFTGPDARLIAAAPEMYEALKNLENDDGKQMPASAWALVCAAIKKAEGKADV